MSDAVGKRRSTRWLYLAGGGAVVFSLVLVLVLVLTRRNAVEQELAQRRSATNGGPPLPVAIVKPGSTTRSVVLTGEVHPYATVTLYAKVSGYLKTIPVDKGDRVREGQVVAVIDSPELESQYQAALVQARNRRDFARREASLLKDGIISQQEAEDATSAARTAEANAAALKTQRGYRILRAPFDGTVTARFADPGALLQSATGGQTGALPVVTISQINRLRIYLYLDQKSAAQVALGDQVVVSDPARPEVSIPATVARIGGELDPKTRTMLVELDVMNVPQRLLAGGYAQVKLTLATPPYLQVPVASVLTRGEKAVVAVVGSDNRVSFREVTIADSDGKSIKLSSGVSEGDRVALNPGGGFTEGELVRPVLQQGAEKRNP